MSLGASDPVGRMNVTPSILVGSTPERERRELLLHELVARDLDAALGHLDRPGDVETIVRDGDAAGGTRVRGNVRRPARLRRGRPGRGGHLLGSTTRRLLDTAACPLVIVPAGTK